MIRLRKNADLISGIVVIPVIYYLCSYFQGLEAFQQEHQKHFETLLVTNVSVMGAFLGFIITTLTVLAGVLPLRIFRKLTKTGRTHELISDFMRLIYVTAIALPISIVSVFFLDSHFNLILFVNLGVGYLWVFNFIECMVLFEAVLKKRFEASDV